MTAKGTNGADNSLAVDSRTRIIGIDCAVDPCNVGVASGYLEDERLSVDGVYAGLDDVEELLRDLVVTSERALLCLDAPLGWPDPLGAALIQHSAGQALSIPPDRLFRRETDRFIRAELGKQSLDVGADKIARTALAALRSLGLLSKLLGQQIPLAWTSEIKGKVSCIEVYPAATLRASGLNDRGYKGRKPESRQARVGLLEQLEKLVVMSSVARDTAEMNEHAFDAVMCALAGADFLRDRSMPPSSVDALVRKEGWIWVRKNGRASR